MAAATPLQIAGDCGRPEACRRRHQLRLELLSLLVDGAVMGGLPADGIVLVPSPRPPLAALVLAGIRPLWSSPAAPSPLTRLG